MAVLAAGGSSSSDGERHVGRTSRVRDSGEARLVWNPTQPAARTSTARCRTPRASRACRRARTRRRARLTTSASRAPPAGDVERAAWRAAARHDRGAPIPTGRLGARLPEHASSRARKSRPIRRTSSARSIARGWRERSSRRSAGTIGRAVDAIAASRPSRPPANDRLPPCSSSSSAALLAASGARAADLRIGLSADVTSIDPHFVNITPNNNVAWHVFEALTHVDEDVRLVPGLAESLARRSTRRPGSSSCAGRAVHDGTELTAEDVAFSIDRPATLTNEPRPVHHVHPADRRASRSSTATRSGSRPRRPYAMVPYDMNSVFIVSKKAAPGASTEDFNTGKARDRHRAVQVRRASPAATASSWCATTPMAARAAMGQGHAAHHAERSARASRALLADDSTRSSTSRPRICKRVRTTPSFRLEQKVSWRTIFLHARPAPRRVPPASPTRPAGRSTAIRSRTRACGKAISKAINRQAIVDRVMDGAAVPASNLVAPPVFGHVASLKPEPYDVEGAQKLLADAGFPNGFTTVLAAPNNRYLNDDQIAQTVAQLLARIGIADAGARRCRSRPTSPKARNQEFPVAHARLGLVLRRSRAALARRRTYDADSGFGAWNWGALHATRSATARRSRRSRPWTSASAKRSRRKRCGWRWPTAPVILLHHQVATWAMRTRPRLHRPHRRVHVRPPLPPAVEIAAHAGLRHPPPDAERRRAVRHVAARLRRRLRDRQPGRHPDQPATPTRRTSSARSGARPRPAAVGAVPRLPQAGARSATSASRSSSTCRRCS